MTELKKEHPKEKSELHPRNKHRQRYDFKQLIQSCPELAPFVSENKWQDLSIDFFNPEAVKMLNKALLKHFYNITYWDIPSGYLCPPIPGRADYIHYIADLLSTGNNGIIPTGNKIKCLDIGTGANCIYPIIGNSEYGWTFVGSDTDSVALQQADRIIAKNPKLNNKIELRLQRHSRDFFKGIIQHGEHFNVTLCNPPFHASLAEAQAGSIRKVSNLKHQKITKPVLNFGGQNNELWCTGGEVKFLRDMIFQSRQFAESCAWFTSLVSKESNLPQVYKTLQQTEALQVKTIPMGQGHKNSRIVAWSFYTPEEQEKWVSNRSEI